MAAWFQTKPTAADRLNLLKQDILRQCREEEERAGRTERPVVHTTGESLSAYTLAPGFSWPTPGPKAST
jgi:hypothetical protein